MNYILIVNDHHNKCSLFSMSVKLMIIAMNISRAKSSDNVIAVAKFKPYVFSLFKFSGSGSPLWFLFV